MIKPEMMELVYLIPYGHENAIHQVDLANLLGVSQMSVKARIKEARLNFIPILSDAHGYWLSDVKQEIELWCATMTRQAMSTLIVAQCLEYTTLH